MTDFSSDTDPTRIDLVVGGQRMTGVTAHGNHYFDVPFISHIVGNLYQGGTEEGLLLPDYIEHLVSLYPWESYTVHQGLRSSRTERLHDSAQQDLSMIEELAHWVNDRCAEGPTLVVCQAGLNRSGIVVARALMLQGYSAFDAIYLIREKRSAACLCNPSFERWLYEQEEK